MQKNLANLTRGIFLLGTLLITPLTSWATATWYTGIVDSGSSNGLDLRSVSDVVSDSNGAMYTCYMNGLPNEDLKYSTNSSGQWVSTTVDSTSRVGASCSIALDSSNKVHISYYESTNNDLKYATNVSGAWVVTTIDSTNSVGLYSSIALDAAGTVYISYYDATNGNLKLANNRLGWTKQLLDKAGDVGKYTSIAILSGKVHISYYDVTNQDLKYATTSGGSWVYTTVDDNGIDNGSFSAIALDSSGYVHISYYGAYHIMHADNLAGSWDTDTVYYFGAASPTDTNIAIASDDTIYVSYGGSGYSTTYSSSSDSTGDTTWTASSSEIHGTSSFAMTLDTTEDPFFIYGDTYALDVKFASVESQWSIAACDGDTLESEEVGQYASLAMNDYKTYVSYYDATNQQLEVVRGGVFYDDQIISLHADGGWTDLIDTTPTKVGYHTSIAVGDGINGYYIAYQDVTDSDLEFYSSVTTTSTITTQETIESTDDQGNYNNLAVDSDGYSHVVYYDATNYDLKYATNESGSWVITTIDGSTTSVGLYPDIVIDNDGFVHISYYNLTGGGKLKYATNESGSWQTETVDSSGGVTGQYTSIGVNSFGGIHIAYYNFSSHDLKYAYGNYGSWTKTSIDTTGDVGKYASLAVDSADQVHISYYDLTNTNLKYAIDSDADGTFETETVDNSTSDVGMYSSIAMYGTIPVIAYYDATAKDLRMAVSP